MRPGSAGKTSGIERRLGGQLRKHGDRPTRLCRLRDADLDSMTVVRHWKVAAVPGPIRRSAEQLVVLVAEFSYPAVALMRPDVATVPSRGAT